MATGASRAVVSQTSEESSFTHSESSVTWFKRLSDCLSRNALFRKFNLRVHKFSFQWDLVFHLSICMLSLTPFFFSGHRIYSLIPLSVWLFYNILFLIGPKHANLVIPGFGRFKHSYKTTVEDFFSPKLLPVLSFSFLLVALTLAVTGHRLGGPPLCYSSCDRCLSAWTHSIPINPDKNLDEYETYRIGCGYANGKELLGYYTMSQTSFLLFTTVMISMAVCLAWRVADEEKSERAAAQEWLEREDRKAFILRTELIQQFGGPASSIRPEGNAVWVFYGVVAALTFTLLGWHNWYVLPPSPSATLLIILNLLTILMSTLILHLGFFGRLLSLYKRNFLRVKFMTECLSTTQEHELAAWWNFRNFVLNDDLSLDYDMGGLAVSATFLIGLVVFFILMTQFIKDGHDAILEPPGSYCAYACMYITSCLIKLFTLATNTFEEQHRHILVLHNLSISLFPNEYSSGMSGAYQVNQQNIGVTGNNSIGNININNNSNNLSLWKPSSETEEYNNFDDNGPIYIDNEDNTIENITNRINHQSDINNNSINNSMHDNINNATSPRNHNNNQTLSTSRSLLNTILNPASLLYNQNNSLPPVHTYINNPLTSNINNNSATSLLELSGDKSPRARPNRSLATLNVDGSYGTGGLQFSVSPRINMAPQSGITAVATMSLQSQSNHNNSSSHGTNGRVEQVEAYRQTIADIISQIRKYDPYPCILGIPVMPPLFVTCKFYIFISFILIGSRAMVLCLKQLKS
eukprot:gene8880-11977_t